MKKIFVLLAALIIFFIIAGNLQENTPEGKDETEIAQKFSAEEQKRMELYITVMKAAFQEENGGDEFIVVKIDTLEGLSEPAKLQVLKALSDLSPKVYGYEDVKDDNNVFELDAEGRKRSIDGSLLWVELEEYSENKAIITGVSWFGSLGAVFPKYEASYNNGGWQLKLIRMAVS